MNEEYEEHFSPDGERIQYLMEHPEEHPEENLLPLNNKITITHIETILKEFDEKFEWTDFSGDIGTHILAKKTSSYATEETERNEIRTFLTTKIAQAIAEERERLEEMRDSPPPYPADKENPMKHIYQNEGYNQALDDLRDNAETSRLRCSA